MRVSQLIKRLMIFTVVSAFIASQSMVLVMAEAVDTNSNTNTVTESTNSPKKDTEVAVEKEPAKKIPEKPKKVYHYNEEAKRWESDKWVYDSGSNKYIPAKPAPTSTEVQPLATDSAVADKSNQTSNKLDVENSVNVQNALNSIAESGSAEVIKNTKAGSAKSGDASSSATIINNLNSIVTNKDNTKAATFTTDIMGDVKGDIMIKPMLLKAMLEAEAENSSDTINLQNSASLTNDINLTAKSGDASVIKNTKAGDAATGSANTVANVVNIVNSMIAANRSFVGTINIYGNLDGDILIAPDFIPQLIASNSPSSSKATDSSVKTIKVSTDDTQTIINNVNLNAVSGSAIVDGNTIAGNAQTGEAATNTVIFNMTGHEIIAKNSLLVFVNVLGKWVGVIVDAPVGATSAAIGNGVSTNSMLSPDITISAKNDISLTNNLNLNSLSGNAAVMSNSFAGSATSGNATASANIANITGSQFGISDWFGILYINVFGNWIGSFGIDTAAGNPLSSTQNTPRKHLNNKPIEFIPKKSHSVSAQQVISLIGDIDPASSSKNLATVAAFESPSPYSGVGRVAGAQLVKGSQSCIWIIFALWLATGTWLVGASVNSIRGLSKIKFS